MFGMHPRTRKNAAKKTRTYDEQRTREKIASAAKRARKATRDTKGQNDAWAFDKLERVIKGRSKKTDPRTKQKWNLI